MHEESLERYSRQIRFAELGEAGQRRLTESRVAVCGCGALGSAIASGLVRAGVGFVRLIDRDFLELSNLQRQTLYDEEDLAADLPKAEAAARKLRRINTQVIVEPSVTDLDHRNIEALCGDVDAIVDGTDNFETRYLINDFACQTGTPWVYGGCIGSEGQCMTIVPGQTACLRCLMPSPPASGTTPTCETAGILGPAATIIASFEVAEALKILSGNVAQVNAGLLVIDVWHTAVRQLSLEGLRERTDCPACKGSRYDWLSGQTRSHTTSLCGRNAVQVVPSSRQPVDWDTLQANLARLTEVRANEHLLRLTLEGYEITLFRDGRAIIKGTDDVSVARGVYSRYVGS